MVNITVSISEDTVKRLRKVIREVYGSRKGTLSSLVEGAIREALDRETGDEGVRYKAFRSGQVVAEGGSLDELAAALKKGGIEVRGLRIESSLPLRPAVRTGPRAGRS